MEQGAQTKGVIRYTRDICRRTYNCVLKSHANCRFEGHKARPEDSRTEVVAEAEKLELAAAAYATART